MADAAAVLINITLATATLAAGAALADVNRVGRRAPREQRLYHVCVWPTAMWSSPTHQTFTSTFPTHVAWVVKELFVEVMEFASKAAWSVTFRRFVHAMFLSVPCFLSSCGSRAPTQEPDEKGEKGDGAE